MCLLFLLLFCTRKTNWLYSLLRGKVHSAFPVTFFIKRITQKPAGIPSEQIVPPEFSHRRCLKSNWVVTLNNTIWRVHSLLLELDARCSFGSILQELIDFLGWAIGSQKLDDLEKNLVFVF